MKCLSLWEPWASLVVFGEKEFETRSWATEYRGPLLIHAAAKKDPCSLSYCMMDPFTASLGRHGIHSQRDFHFGRIIGVVDVVGMFRMTAAYGAIRGGPEYILCVSPKERQFGDYDEGRWAWRLKNPRRFVQPMKYRGLQKIFNVPDHVVAEQLAKAGVA